MNETKAAQETTIENAERASVKKRGTKEERPVEPVLTVKQYALSRALNSLQRVGFETWISRNKRGNSHTASEFDELLKEFEV